jgi:1-acyl-sn-glycerol-3-phosphate acyltransferase
MIVRDGTWGRLARWTARAAARFYYPNIEISDRDRIPASGPVLLAANHQNSLLDPVLVGLTARRPVRFLAKAPLFRLPVVGQLLHAFGMLPVHRQSDDPTQMHRNLETLAVAAEKLTAGDAVGIFPEGRSHDAPRLEAVKSGAARLALQAVRAGAVHLRIVPVGLNYQRKEQFRSAVWIRVGEPIEVAAWLADRARKGTGAGPGGTGETQSGELESGGEAVPSVGEHNERQTVRALSAELDRRLRALVVDLDEPSWEPFLQELEVLLPPPRSSRRNPFAWLRQRKRLADAVNHFMRQDPARAGTVADRIKRCRAQLSAAHLTARSAVLRWRGLPLAGRLLGEAVLMCLGFVGVLLGTLFHLIPFLLTRGVARWVQSSGKSTVALARFGVGLPVYAGWYAFHAWWISLYFLPWVAWAWLLPMPVAGLWALRYWRRVERTSPGWWRDLFMMAQPSRLRTLRAEHDQLRAALAEMTEEYRKVQPAEPLPRNSFSWRRLAWGTLRWAAVGLVIFLAIAWIRSRQNAGDLEEMILVRPAPEWRSVAPETMAANLADDEKVLGGAMDGLQRLESEAGRLQSEFLRRQRDFYSQADDDAIRRAMLSYLTLRTTLLGLSWKYQQYEEIPDERSRMRAFLLLLGSSSAISDASLRLVTRFGPHPNSVRKLNEGDAAWGLPAGLFARVVANLRQGEVRQFMEDALARYRAAAGSFRRLNLEAGTPYVAIHEIVRRHEASRESLLAAIEGSSLAEPLEEAGRMTKSLAYHGQAFVSTWLGSTRFRRPRAGQLMIAVTQLEEFRQKLQPGDILVERQNWFLSRAFMPGYWAHAALYVGGTNDLVRLGLDRDPRVMARWREYAARNSEGHEHLILEAVPQGVRMTTLEHCIGVADAAAVLRPRLDEARIKEAIARAFGHLGKEYDFDFDFFTSDRLVCTELVYRCYDGALQFPLVDVMGRKTLPPTELVRKFVQERGRPAAQLDCVCFLDGDEGKGRAVFREEEVFITTVERPGLMLLPAGGK